jgi:hypothetical protein
MKGIRYSALAALVGVAILPGVAIATSLFSTIDTEGKVPELSAARSELFETLDAGLVRDGRNLGYYWVIKPNSALEATLYVRVSYANPCGESLVNDAVIDPKLKKIGLSSPSYVLGLEKGKMYDFKLEVFRNKGDDAPIDVLEQRIVSVFTAWGCA